MKARIPALIAMIVLVALLSAACGPVSLTDESTSPDENMSRSAADLIRDVSDPADCFYESGATDGFTASDEYGSVLPYTGSLTEYESGGDIVYYGFMTGDGKIITAPIYGYMSCIERNNGEFCYLAARKTTEGGLFAPDVVASDGSWALHYDGYDTTVYSENPGVFVPEELICVRDDDSIRYYGFDGRLKYELDPAKFFDEDKDRYFYRPEYFDGEHVFVEDYDDDDVLMIRICDLDGNVLTEIRGLSYVFGECGKDAVLMRREDGSCVLVSGDGKTIREGEDCTKKSDSSEFYWKDGDHVTVTDAGGNVLREIPLDYSLLCNNGCDFWFEDYETDMYYNSAGEPMYFTVPGAGPVVVEQVADGGWDYYDAPAYFFALDNEGGADVFNVKAEFVTHLDSVLTYSHTVEGADEYYTYDETLLFVHEGRLIWFGGENVHVYGIEDGTQFSLPLSVREDSFYPEMFTDRLLCVDHPLYDDESYTPRTDLIDIKTGEYIRQNDRIIERIGRTVCCADGDSAVMLDLNGNIIMECKIK